MLNTMNVRLFKYHHKATVANVFNRLSTRPRTRPFSDVGSTKPSDAGDAAKPKKQKVKWERRIFSGIQPSGVLHLGNYFGAIQKWIELQDEGNDVLYSIVDLHSLTLPQDPEELRSRILLMTASLIACGIDPYKSILFQQSKVHQHTELAWVLCCHATMARLTHLPQFREKSADMKDIPLGLYIYPVLMAADILLYRATHVPVGEDQVQHLQLATHFARIFNNRYSEIFPVPQLLMEDSARNRVRSLREPLKKMSKSHVDARSRIELTDTADQIVEKIKKSVTDFTSEVTYDPEARPGVSNLVALHAFCEGKSFEQVCQENSHLDTGGYKRVVADAIITKLGPIREELTRLIAAPEYLEEVLDQGSQRAMMLAEITWFDVKQQVGLQTLPLPRSIDITSAMT